MKKGIVEGNDYSVLPVPAIRLVRWLQASILPRRRVRGEEAGAAPSDDGDAEAQLPNTAAPTRGDSCSGEDKGATEAVP